MGLYLLILAVDEQLKLMFRTFVFQATFKGWMDIMYAAVDSREVSCTETVTETVLIPMHRSPTCEQICVFNNEV